MFPCLSSSTADISTVQDRHAPTPAPPATVASAVVRAADNDGNTESTKTSHELPTTSSALEVASGHDSNAESTGTSHALPTTASAVELAGSVPGTSPEHSGASSDVGHLDAGSGKEIPATGHAGNSDSRDKASEGLEPAAKRSSVPESSSLPLQVEVHAYRCTTLLYKCCRLRRCVPVQGCLRDILYLCPGVEM